MVQTIRDLILTAAMAIYTLDLIWDIMVRYGNLSHISSVETLAGMVNIDKYIHVCTKYFAN